MGNGPIVEYTQNERMAKMQRKIALIIGIILMAIYAYAADPPAGYEWASPLGALRKSTNTGNIYVFDTSSGNHLTANKQAVVDYQDKRENQLTDLGKTLRGKLLKIEGVSAVAVEYRRLWVRKFPLDDWATILPEIQKVLK